MAQWLLGLDGATEMLTLVLQRSEGATGIGRSVPGGAQASAQLLPAIRALLAEGGVSPQDLLGLGFGQGPGAFTSLRAICAATQGLAEGWGLPVLPINSLLLSVDDAAGPAPAQGLWGAVMDARMGEVYAASYQRSAAGWRAVLEPSLWQPEALSAHWAQQAPLHYAGHGVALLPGCTAIPSQDRAAALGRLLQRAWRDGPRLDASEAQPLYVRNRVALTTAEREAQRRGATA